MIIGKKKSRKNIVADSKNTWSDHCDMFLVDADDQLGHCFRCVVLIDQSESASMHGVVVVQKTKQRAYTLPIYHFSRMENER